MLMDAPASPFTPWWKVYNCGDPYVPAVIDENLYESESIGAFLMVSLGFVLGA